MKWLAVSAVAFVVSIIGCTTTTSAPPLPGEQTKSPPGFFDRLAEQWSARECNVGRFTCPYGLGPVGEPCECADPKGFVFKGRTVR